MEWYKPTPPSFPIFSSIQPSSSNPVNFKEKLNIINQCRDSKFIPGTKVVRMHYAYLGKAVSHEMIGRIKRYTIEKFPQWEDGWRPLVVEFPNGKTIIQFSYYPNDLVLFDSIKDLEPSPKEPLGS